MPAHCRDDEEPEYTEHDEYIPWLDDLLAEEAALDALDELEETDR
jgi:hypothetical protein